MINLKDVYKTSTEELAFQNLKELNDKWGAKYTLADKLWIVHWDNLKIYPCLS